MAELEQGADEAALRKVRVKMEAEFCIDPLDHFPLDERRAMLLAGKETKLPGDLPMCGGDLSLKRINHRLLLEMLMSDLVCTLRSLGAHGNQEQIITESFMKYDLGSTQCSGGQIYEETFSNGRFLEIQDAAVTIEFGPAGMSSHMAVNIEERHPLEDCGAECSQSNALQNFFQTPFSGQTDHPCEWRDTGADLKLSSPDDIMRMKTEYSVANALRDSCVPHESKINMPAEAEKGHFKCSPKYEIHKVPLSLSISGSCSQMDSPLESNNCSPLAELSNTIAPGQSSVCYAREPYQDDSSNYSQDTIYFHNLKEDQHEGICSEKPFANCLKAPLVAELEGSVKDELAEESHVACTSEATPVSEFSTLTFNSSDIFLKDAHQDTSSCSCSMQAIQEGHMLCTNKMDSIVPTGKNIGHVLPGLFPLSLPEHVKIELLKGNHMSNFSVLEAAVQYNSSSETSDEAAGVNMVLTTFPMRVKDEPLEENAIDNSESILGEDSDLIVHPPMNDFSSNPLLGVQCSLKAMTCQGDSASNIHRSPNEQEATTCAPQFNISGNCMVSSRQEEISVVNPHNLDVSPLKGTKDVEQMDKTCAHQLSRKATGALSCLCLSDNLILKEEPMENPIENSVINPLDTFSSPDISLVKTKSEIVEKFSEDILDNLTLSERSKMLALSTLPDLKPSRKSRFSEKTFHGVDFDYVGSTKNKVKSTTIQRKRKRTATDSVEVALEEDAPGLLQRLLDRGINPDEIKLYGCEEDVDALDISSSEDNFEDFECVISKIFFGQPTSLFKLAPLRHAKGAKATYCLSCLISLIEQTRYLQFRNHPVEWGWCRDLQSFIFVFKMHNRIVLERPEYGYATYFFELVESYPVDWQIKRLVTAMKLTSCNRATMIENKPLMVGVDLSEGEARVLEEYGWLPSTGFGSMLNYCDRVVHDRNDRDVSEWRSKIGKLLMDGYDGGTVVKVNVPKKVADYVGSHLPEINMET